MRADEPTQRTFRTRWPIAVVSALLAVYVLMPDPASADSDVAPPPRHCWGGVLFEDPLHCYVFEEAQRAGLMEVDSIFLAPGLAPLYVYLKQSEMPNAALLKFLRDKTYEYMAQPGEGPDSYGAANCDGLTGNEWYRCVYVALDFPDWIVNRDFPDWILYSTTNALRLPASLEYHAIVIRVGDPEARRSVGGWASWKQLWPAPVGGASDSGSTGFDVSDVDLTNISGIDCRKGEFYRTQMKPSCRAWVDLAGAEPGFAGIHVPDNRDAMYVQTTTPIPEDPAGLEVLKRRLAPAFEAERRWSMKAKSESYKVKFIPVKYDFGQLWRWHVILNRFVLSAGNTVGIVGAWLDMNVVFDDGRNPGYTWLNGVQPTVSNGATWNLNRMRNILRVETLDPEATIAAFPTLLPALGIPIDAVGLVVRSDHRPWGPAMPLPGNTQPAEAPPLPGDCWDGVLSKDPLHCYVFEEAQKAGLLEVDSMYLAPGRAPLYVYLEQSELPSMELLKFLHSKTYEYMAQPGEGPDSYGAWNCADETGNEWLRCIYKELGRPSWSNYISSIDSVRLPRSLVYPAIAFGLGGGEARRSVSGWASWKQLWPAPVGGASASGLTGLYVSGIDLTNIPEIDCEEHDYGSMRTSCWAWLYDDDPGVAGVHANWNTGDTIYVQTTTRIPEDPVKLEALKQRVVPGYEKIPLSRTYRVFALGPRTSFKMEVIPAKYNFGQLWIWHVILERFALSAGNTVGIDGAWVRTNAEFDDGRDPEYTWLNGVQPAGSNGSTWNWEKVRSVLAVMTLDPEATIAAFPTLLPALGIPTDAVGLVIRLNKAPGYPPVLHGDAQPAQTPTPAGMRAPPPELDCSDDSGAPLLSFCDAW